MIGLIYCATSPNGKRYVGKTQKTLEQRREKHCAKVNEGSQTKFHRALRKYGANSFIWEVLECCEINKLDEREQHYITHFASHKSGYNMTLGGEGGARTLETRKKMSLAHLGHVCSPDRAKKIGDAQRGKLGFWYNKQHSDETRQKMSQSQKKSSFWRGKSLFNEMKAKISQTLKGHVPWNKGKKKQSDGSYQ